jgi:hypothetical protein
MYRGKTLLIVTKHAKEKVIAPVFEKELGVKCIVSSEIDTDILGTFSGEVDRKDTPIETAKKKCLLGLQYYDVDLVIANEGSFGPHPQVYFNIVDEEWMYFMDRNNAFDIYVRQESFKTNYNHQTIHSWEEMEIFALKIDFPTHGIILKKSSNDFSEVVKDIETWPELKKWTCSFLNKQASMYVETDMRAFRNPTRMEVIEKAANKLVEKINSKCPQCCLPGFSVTQIKEGLLCSQCKLPTHVVKSTISECLNCGHATENLYPYGNQFADPAHCDFCNP